MECLGNAEALLALEMAQRESYDLIYTFSQKSLDEKLVTRFSGLDVGGQTTFVKPLSSGKEQQEIPANIQEITDKESDQALIELALLSGRRSRFRTDTRLPQGSFERLYRLWLSNCLIGDNSVLLIRGSRHNPDGLVTADWEQTRCSIGLLAVRQEKQGMGVGSELLKALELKARMKGAKQISVKTQAINHGARSFYARNGYQCTGSTNLYHLYPRLAA